MPTEKLETFPKTGGLPKPPDSNDIKLGATGAPVYTFPPTLTNAAAWAQPVEYQGQQPACGPHSGAELEGITRASRYSPQWTQFDVKSFDGYPIDEGTDIRSIFKSITKGRGVLDFPLLGNQVTLSEQAYAHPTVTPAMTANAEAHLGKGYGFITDLTFNGIKQFISDHGPGIVLLRIGTSWWTAPNGTASYLEKDICPMRLPTGVLSGHFVVVHSYDENYIYFLNHFGDSWGRKGHGYFGANYMPEILDAGTFFPLTFTKDLWYSVLDPDVVLLQKYLNDHGFEVANSGAGSPGQESQYFGTLTEIALKKFQAANGISPASGYFGPLTRAFVTLHS